MVTLAMLLSRGPRAPWPLDLTVAHAEASPGPGPPLAFPSAIAVEATGALVVVDGACTDAAVLRVDPVSGDRTVVSGARIGTGPDFEFPQEITVEATGTLVVLHAGRVLRVDPVSGDRTAVGSRFP
jgi:hypothetical protein